MIKMEESVLGTFPWMIPGLFFIEIGQGFLTKNSRSNVLYGNKIAFSIPEREKQTQIITSFAPINDRIRIDLAAFTSTHIKDRELL
jgi:hypothetical protein